MSRAIVAREFLPGIGVIRFLNADEIARGLSPLKPEAAAFKAGRLRGLPMIIWKDGRVREVPA